MKINKYYEYRSWVGFWGLFLDGDKIIKYVIEQHNKQGWNVIQFEWGISKLTFFKLLLVNIVSLLTLGFFNYWVGFCIIFEKESDGVENVVETNIDEPKLSIVKRLITNIVIVAILWIHWSLFSNFIFPILRWIVLF